jgi:hypothetical protein
VASEQSKKVKLKQGEVNEMPKAFAQAGSLQQAKPNVSGKVIERREVSRERRASDDRRKLNDTEKDEKTVAIERLNERNEMKLQQHRRKILLAGCEPVMGFNYDCLAMDDYPSNALVSGAKRDRDYWLMLCGLFATAFLLGVMGLVAAWVAGAGCGLFLLSLVFSVTSFSRQKIDLSALNHLHFLEGADGLAWRCEKLVKYNTNLNRKIFHGLFRYSKDRSLLSVIKNKKHIRLYLLLMIESQKAYKRLQKDYLARHFKNLDQGLDDTISEMDAAKLQQTLNLD